MLHKKRLQQEWIAKIIEFSKTLVRKTKKVKR